MADEIPVIPKVSVLEVRTGNIVNWNRLKRRPSYTPTAEVADCITATVKKYLDASDKTGLQYVKELECVDTDQQQALLTDERGELKVLVKVFVCANDQPAEVVLEAIDKVMSELNVSFVETVLLSLSIYESEEEIDMTLLKRYWEVLEDLVAQGRVLSIGVSDLDKDKLEQLYQMAKVKPTINQLNLVSCCVTPKDLTEYAKQVNIQLQSHTDPLVLLPSSQLQEALRHCGTEQDSFGWSPLWVARYSIHVKCRGIIKSKGYIIRAIRDPHRRV